MAKKDADYIYSFKDDKCGGGVWWSKEKKYKNAITNELFIKLAAAIHNRAPGDTKYLAQATEVALLWLRGHVLSLAAGAAELTNPVRAALGDRLDRRLPGALRRLDVDDALVDQLGRRVGGGDDIGSHVVAGCPSSPS